MPIDEALVKVPGTDYYAVKAGDAIKGYVIPGYIGMTSVPQGSPESNGFYKYTEEMVQKDNQVRKQFGMTPYDLAHPESIYLTENEWTRVSGIEPGKPGQANHIYEPAPAFVTPTVEFQPTGYIFAGMEPTVPAAPAVTAPAIMDAVAPSTAPVVVAATAVPLGTPNPVEAVATAVQEGKAAESVRSVVAIGVGLGVLALIFN